MAQAPELVIMGAMNVDDSRRVSEIFTDGEGVPLSSSLTGGGSGMNTGAGCARLEHDVAVIGAVGDDERGANLINEMRAEGVDTSCVSIKQGERTGEVLVVSDATHRMMLISGNANLKLSRQDIDNAREAGLDRPRWLHLASFVDDNNGGEPQLRLQEELLESVPETTTVSLSPGEIYARKGMKGLGRLLERTNVLVCNWREISLLAGEPMNHLWVASRALFSRFPGLQAIAVTLGEGRRVGRDSGDVFDPDEHHRFRTIEESLGGYSLSVLSSVIFTPDSRIDVPQLTAADDQPKHPLGAGDAWLAGFLHGQLTGQSLYASGVIADIVAQFSLSKEGARAGLPTRAQLERVLAQISLSSTT